MWSSEVGGMPVEIMNVGFGNLINAARIVAVTRAGSAPVRRMIDGAQQGGRLVDATSGRRTRAVIVTDSNHVILSHLTPQTIGERLSGTVSDAVRRMAGDGEEEVPDDVVG